MGDFSPRITNSSHSDDDQLWIPAGMLGVLLKQTMTVTMAIHGIHGGVLRPVSTPQKSMDVLPKP